MELVRAGLGLHSDNARGGLAGFRVVILKSDLRFGDGVEVRIHDDDAKDGILVIGAVQLKVGAREVLSIHLDLPAALRIFGGSVVEPGSFCVPGESNSKLVKLRFRIGRSSTYFWLNWMSTSARSVWS